VPILIPAGAKPARLLAANARVAPDDGEPGGDRGVERRLAALQARVSDARGGDRGASSPGLAERGARAIPRRASPVVDAAAPAVADCGAAFDPALGPLAWAPDRGSDAVAAPGNCRTDAALARDRLHLDRPGRGAGPATADPGSGPSRRGRLRAARRPADTRCTT